MSINEQELKIIRSDIQDLKAEISLLNQNFSALEELLRLLVANQMLNNVEIEKPPKIENPPKTKEVLQGRDKIYAVGGSLYAVMLSGKILSDSIIKVIRSGKIIFNTKISYLDSFHQGTREITYGYFQCQLSGVDNNKIEENDIIEAYTWE